MNTIARTILLLMLLVPAVLSAQMMGGAYPPADDHTQKEEAAGKDLWQKFQAKEIDCARLADDDFAALGEYFMGVMMGSSHAAMNAMMTSSLGEQGEETMHVAMGKRLSGCDATAAYPVGGTGFMPMMNMMWGPYGAYPSHSTSLGYGAFTLGFFGLILWFLWWIFIIALIVFIVRKLFTLWHQSQPNALDILKERYAKGEIDKKEFEERKHDVG